MELSQIIRPSLAEISFSSGGLTHGIFVIFIAVLIGLILWGLGRYFFPKFGMPPFGMLIWDGLFILIAALILINFLAGLAGHAFIAW